ncbi:hypothetical protein M2171_001390 [Bradyrhizobium japonicum USDA 38]|nr:hypothetical protein [Bradyrhizobium japonicum USDA 38]MCS3944771.1 hypothetical protein [Bradyrhizobium japonicum]
MLTLLRLPFLLVLPDDGFITTRTSVFVSNWLMGSAPRARQGEAPAHAGADPGGLPGLPRCPQTTNHRGPAHSLVQTRFQEAALSGGRSPSALVALALATPGLADGQGRRRGVRALRP